MTDWTDREQYGDILREIITDLKKEYDSLDSIQSKAKYGHALAYLIQVQSSLITAESRVESRIAELERVAGITRRGVIHE